MTDETEDYREPDLCMECGLNEALYCSNHAFTPEQAEAIQNLLKVIDTLPESRMAYAGVLIAEAEKKHNLDTPLRDELFQLGQAHSQLTVAFKGWTL